MKSLRKITDAIWLVCNALFGSVYFEHAFMVFMGIALLGASGKWSVALGVALPIYWMHEKNKRIAQLERVVKLNGDFWESADSKEGMSLVKTMRELCSAALPNNEDDQRPQSGH